MKQKFKHLYIKIKASYIFLWQKLKRKIKKPKRTEPYIYE